MTSRTSDRRLFSLDEAQQLLPHVKHLTQHAVERVDALAGALDSLDEHDPERAAIQQELDEAIGEWARSIQELDLEAKGLWLVDFDNGEGYYCWKHPETSITHFHGYDDGFAGRMKIT